MTKTWQSSVWLVCLLHNPNIVYGLFQWIMEIPKIKCGYMFIQPEAKNSASCDSVHQNRWKLKLPSNGKPGSDIERGYNQHTCFFSNQQVFHWILDFLMFCTLYSTTVKGCWYLLEIKILSVCYLCTVGLKYLVKLYKWPPASVYTKSYNEMFYLNY